MDRTGMTTTKASLRIAFAAALCLSTAACTSSSVDDITVSPASYPSVYKPVNAATVQMTDTEAGDQEARLTRLGAVRASGAISQAEYLRRRAELDALAANHGTDTQNEIANERLPVRSVQK